MSRNLKIAAAQLGPIQLADRRDSVVERLVEMLREAHSAGCKLVVFPELALTTFFPRYVYRTQAEIDVWFETEMPSAATRPLFDEASRLGVGFYLGYAELAEEDGERRHFNTSVLVGPDAKVVGKYRKVHLPGHAEPIPGAPFQHLEKRYFDYGNLGFPVWRAFDTVIGMCICNDRRWPETYRVMGLQGAELIVLGYNTPTANIDQIPEPAGLKPFHNRLSLQAGAYQNASWVVAAAKAGSEDGHGLIGGSCIVAPTGEIVAQALGEDDEVIVYNCDLSAGEYLRRTTFAFERHRRPEHYRLITERAGVISPPDP